MKKFFAIAWMIFVLVLALRVFGIVSNTWIVISLFLLVLSYSWLIHLFPEAARLIHACFWVITAVLAFLLISLRFPFTVSMLDTAMTDGDLSNGKRISRFSELRQDLMAKLGRLEGFETVQEMDKVNAARRSFEEGKISEDSLLSVYSRVAEISAARAEKINKVASFLGSEKASVQVTPNQMAVTYVIKEPDKRDQVSIPTSLKKGVWSEEINLFQLQPFRSHFNVDIAGDSARMHFRDGKEFVIHPSDTLHVWGHRPAIYKLMTFNRDAEAVSMAWNQ